MSWGGGARPAFVSYITLLCESRQQLLSIDASRPLALSAHHLLVFLQQFTSLPCTLLLVVIVTFVRAV